MSKRSASPRSTPPLLIALYIGAGLSVAAVIVFLALVLMDRGGNSEGITEVPDGYPYPVQAIERIGDRTHFPIGTVFEDYTSNPPTSGLHAAIPAPFGISDVPIAREVAVHNMEHAGVIVWYNCNAEPALSADACTQLRNRLAQVVQGEIAAGERVLMTPYEGMDNRIALTAWGFLDTFEDFDADRVSRFVETFECNFDPEGFCD